MTDTGDLPPLDGDLGWMLGVLFRAYVRASDHALQDLPGGPRGYQVLTAAVARPPRNQVAIADELGLDRTVLTYLIDDLEAAGLLTRRADPADRRSRLVEATDAGRAAWSGHRQVLDRVEAGLLGPLDAADTDTVRRLLQRLAGAAQRRDPVADLCQVAERVQRDADPGPHPAPGAAARRPARSPRRPRRTAAG
ncbi:MarR family winged helix-turn-helix transcriptional regulator [Nakamurella endophytica]|uniref:HTH marR-type domain-containing protein n=1 Tax=Nakamurella endophytica TaxID=1748367 RepID=A0A917TBK6_9ACTN|nr:MarR family winged helix-turn-helix transcriptional regulator [Nakamurella endophytica]GGM16293.1 hypothetical protein GCM10011594_40440 [Nakamurella endophytica]